MKPAMVGIVVILLPGVAGGGLAPRDVPAESVGWDPESAAKYLDQRMDAWFENGKKLKTGSGETVCVSCHTAVPYALSRPVLRRAMRARGRTPQEVRLLEEVTRRVATYDSHQPQYDSSEAKKAESRGTEAVLNALILAAADAEEPGREAGEPARRAFGRLWETQRPDGAWDWLDFGLEPLETAGAAYHGATLAALAVGTAPGISATKAAGATAGLERLRRYLREKYPEQNLFNRVWALLASTRCRDVVTAAAREALISEIGSRQRDDGGWALEALGPWRWSKAAAPFRPPGTPAAALLAASDGYATGLIVYTLREAGIRRDHPTVRRGLEWLRASQREVSAVEPASRAWRAHSLNFDRERGGPKGEPWRRMFMSDAATAFAVLALAAPDVGKP